MSYILEALRKAERERTLGQVPTLEVGGAAPEPHAPRPWWPWLLAVALLVNGIVLVIWLLSPRAPAPLPAVETAASVPSPVLELPPPPPPSVADYLPPPVTVVEEPIREPVIAELPPPEPMPDPRPRPTPQAVAPEPVMTAAEEDISEAPALETPPPLRDMPPEFRRSVPEMKVDAHFYTTVPGRSFVMINLRKYRAGERTTEGPQVVEIVPEGVVMSYQGQQFLLPP